MNILTLTFMLIGIVFIIMGYMSMFYNIKKEDSLTEYRTSPLEMNNMYQSKSVNGEGLQSSILEIKDENGNDVSFASF